MTAWGDLPAEVRRDIVEAARADLDLQHRRASYSFSNLLSDPPSANKDRAIPIASARVDRFARALAALATLPID